MDIKEEVLVACFVEETEMNKASLMKIFECDLDTIADDRIHRGTYGCHNDKNETLQFIIDAYDKRPELAKKLIKKLVLNDDKNWRDLHDMLDMMLNKSDMFDMCLELCESGVSFWPDSAKVE